MDVYPKSVAGRAAPAPPAVTPVAAVPAKPAEAPPAAPAKPAEALLAARRAETARLRAQWAAAHAAAMTSACARLLGAVKPALSLPSLLTALPRMTA